MTLNEPKYNVLTAQYWMHRHWVLNPGLAINELLLGQRIPILMLEDKTSDKDGAKKMFVPCPHCGTLHDARIFSKLPFKNWFGFYCSHCGDIIPCLTNCTSRFILTITSPFFGWMKKPFKRIWLKAQPARYARVTNLN